MTSARAFAKVNLGLRVQPRDESGLHPLTTLCRSIDWADGLTVEEADEDRFTVSGPVDDGPANLAWRAVEAVRLVMEWGGSFAVHLDKEIPVASGLAGGSADAAAGLEMAARLLKAPSEVPGRIAPALGADVPFCLIGGLALVEGHGEHVHRLPDEPDHVLGVVVPEFELSTADVYRRWDDMGGPAGPDTEARELPPSLREYGPLGNDLLPAAREMRPELGDWMADVAGRWGRPVHLSGSGPAVFAYFADMDEAGPAVEAVAGARAARAAAPIGRGWSAED